MQIFNVEIPTNLMNFQQFVNIFPIKIFHLVSYLPLMNLWLHQKYFIHISEAPSLENHNIRSPFFVTLHSYTIKQGTCPKATEGGYCSYIHFYCTRIATVLNFSFTGENFAYWHTPSIFINMLIPRIIELIVNECSTCSSGN